MHMAICLGRVCKVRHFILNWWKECLSTLKNKQTISSLSSLFRHYFFLIAFPYEILIPSIDYISVMYCVYIFEMYKRE